MATTRLTAATLAATLALAACSMPNYIPAHGQGLEEAAAARLECKAISEGMTPPQGGFVAAAGKPAFVAGTMAGYGLGLAIAAAVRQQHRIELYGDCMEAHGFRKEESHTTTAAATPQP